MNSPKHAEVIQGRLGWEPGDVSQANPENLRPHPKNQEVYGDTNDSDDLDNVFKESVAEKGVLEPLVITQGKQIVSGHRRWLAAKDAGLDTVPVRFAEFDNDLAEREALIEFNRQREKTAGQIVNEFEEVLAVEKERAKENMSKGGRGERVGNVSNPSDNETSAAREKAAEKVNADISGRTLEKGLDVKKKAEDGNETAQREWDKLQKDKTSFHRAKKNVEKAEAQRQIEEQREGSNSANDKPTVQQAHAAELLSTVDDADLLLTDPPYITDVDDIGEFARSWLPSALNVVNEDGVAFITVGAYADELQTYLNVLEECGVRDRTQVLVWTYRNTLGQTPKDQYKRNWQAILFVQSEPATNINAPLTSEQWAVQDINAPDGRHDGRHHKWEKPTELVERLIRHTTDRGDLVIDPFVGTGTTAIVASELEREVIAGDISENMLEIAVERGCIVDGN